MNIVIRNGNEITCATDAGFLFIFKTCKQARSTGKCKCRLRQDAGCDHSDLSDCLCNTEDEQKNKSVSNIIKFTFLSKLWIFLAIALLISGCSTVQVSSINEIEKENYQKAIIDAAIIEKTEIVPLPIVNEDTVRVVTWTKFPDSYPEGKETTLKWNDVWVTLDDDVKSRCQNFHKDTLVSDLQKLLGLPLDNSGERSFVTLEVDSNSLFRPCANPSLQAEECSPEFPEDIPQTHVSWYAYQVAKSYQFGTGYPWTRLGYTFNWKSGESEVGPAEFVVKKGSKVLFISVKNTSLYCIK